MKNQSTEQGIYRTLVAQLDSLKRHNRQGSYRTRKRYYEAMERFCRFLAEEYHMQNLRNISHKHIDAYVEHMQADGKSASTIKTDLSAIRFWHDQMGGTRHPLPSNDDLAVTLERRHFGQVDRTWGDAEVQQMVAIARQSGHDDYALAILLARHLGLRLHECYRIDTAIAQQAIGEHAITVKGKGGKVRTVPIGDDVYPFLAAALQSQIANTRRGHKLLVPDDVPTDIAMQQLEQFILANRSLVKDADSTRPMTYHGLRHTKAAEWYQEFIREGKSPYEARKTVSKLLGHGRDDVTRIYLASLKSGKEGDENGDSK